MDRVQRYAWLALAHDGYGRAGQISRNEGDFRLFCSFGAMPNLLIISFMASPLSLTFFFYFRSFSHSFSLSIYYSLSPHVFGHGSSIPFSPSVPKFPHSTATHPRQRRHRKARVLPRRRLRRCKRRSPLRQHPC